MSEKRFEKLDQLDGGERVKIYFSGDKTTVAGVEIESPLETTVRYIAKQRLDHQKGDDVDGIGATSGSSHRENERSLRLKRRNARNTG